MKKLIIKNIGLPNIKIVFSILFILLFTYCNQRNSIKYIRFIYLDKTTLTPIIIDSCKNIYHYKSIKDTTIYDREIIDTLSSILDDLEPIVNDYNRIDYRLICMIILENGDTTGFCTGGFDGIRYNKEYVNSPRLFKLINKILYSDSIFISSPKKPKASE